jgi:hypothetical protein
VALKSAKGHRSRAPAPRQSLGRITYCPARMSRFPFPKHCCRSDVAVL